MRALMSIPIQKLKKAFEQEMSGSNSALGLLMTYDSRDNMMGANEGIKRRFKYFALFKR